jgi:hypothetical protein
MFWTIVGALFFWEIVKWFVKFTDAAFEAGIKAYHEAKAETTARRAV